MQNLSPIFAKGTQKEFLQGKMETFLTCRVASAYLRDEILNETAGNFLEEISLIAIHQTLFTQCSLADIKLLIKELPKILPLKYSVIDDIRKDCLQIIPNVLNFYRIYDANAWKEFVNLKYLTEMLSLIH